MDERIHKCLARLAPHLDLTRVAVTGGVAIDLHLGPATRGTHRSGQPAHDLDLLADAADAISAGVVNEFLVSHFHLPQPGYQKFLIQLVDPVAGVRVDVFPDSLGLLPETTSRAVAGHCMRVVAPCALLEHKLALLASASPERPVDEKHYADIVWLADYCGRLVPDVAASVLRQPEYSCDLDMQCPRCDASRHPDFPLAQKRRILDVLGYV